MESREMKTNKKVKIKGCACYGVNSIHPCFCSPFSNKETKSKKEEIEAVDSLLNTFGQYCTLNGIKLTDSNKVGQAVIDFLKSDIYEIFKNQK